MKVETITLRYPEDGYVRVSDTHVVPMFPIGQRLRTTTDGGEPREMRVVGFDLKAGTIDVLPYGAPNSAEDNYRLAMAHQRRDRAHTAWLGPVAVRR